MTIHEFISALQENKPFKKSVICITGESYPLLFCSQLFTPLHKKGQLAIPDMSDERGLQSQMSMSFLGSGIMYWLRSLDELTKSAQESWISFFDSYSGPHTLIFFCIAPPKTIPDTWQIIRIPEYADAESIALMASWYESKPNKKFLNLIHGLDKLSLDRALLLVRYSLLVGAQYEQFRESCLSKLLEPNNSFFAVSQALFAKQPRQFFSKIKSIDQEYGPQFWISFWSEQLWRAAEYIKAMKAHRQAEAKRIGYRLPFSFLNRDWHRCNTQELINAHEFLCDIDYQLKNGADAGVLDLFYSKFFSGRFV